MRNPESIEADTKLFWPDKPALRVQQDRFDHRYFVEALKYVILNGEVPLNIALYGKWGVGKSSILEFFRRDVSENEALNNKFKFVVIDVWKLSPHILKQEFLEDLNLKLGSLRHKEIDDRLWHQREETSNRNMSLRARYAVAIVVGAAIFGAVAAVSQYFLSYFESHPWLSSSFVASVIPIFVVIAKELWDLSKSVTKSRTIIPRIESHAQFYKLFEDIIGKVENGKKPIIAIDNLDRCDNESVSTILKMIKTFLDDPKCFFIVACDQDAIIKHLQGKEQFDQRYAKEFLGKFFQVSLYVRS